MGGLKMLKPQIYFQSRYISGKIMKQRGITRISKEASPASILGRIWCDVSSRTCLAGLSVLCIKRSVRWFTLVCCVLCEFCESVLALECCKSWGVAGVKAASPV